MPKRTWTDDQLVDAVAASTSMREVIQRLGLRQASNNTLRGHFVRLGIDASHIPAAGPKGAKRRPRSWTDEELRRVVAQSSSHAEVQRALGYEPSGGIHRWLSKTIRALDISTEHFVGQAWARGRRFPGSKSAPLDELLREGTTVSSGHLRKRLIRVGLKPAHCEGCGISEWQGAPIPLMLDHINGDSMDNRLENLRILCPNCHAQTPTWCSRNRKKWPA